MTQTILVDATISELPNHYKGKVRDCYDLEGQFEGTRLIISTDRLSAFDKNICAIPEKGRVLTKTAAYWFRHTSDICPNHVLDYPDSNVLVCKKLKMLPVEIIIRDYLAGTTDTSILSMYKKGMRYVYGQSLPDGLRDNQLLPTTIITPTTKDTRDIPLSGWNIVDRGMMSVELWTQICRVSLDLFAFARDKVAKNGLILADAKLEFGLDENGTLTLADEIFTPDSSRYWFLDSYQACLDQGIPPQSYDKDVVRRWVSERCDPYKEPIPEIPADMIEETSHTYVDAYETITGMIYTHYTAEIPILDRIRAALHLAGILVEPVSEPNSEPDQEITA